MSNQPPYCNAFIEAGWKPFSQCGYPVNDLIGVNKKELVHIFVWLKNRYEHDASPDVLRKIKAMRKVLKHFDLYKELSKETHHGE